MFSENFYTLRKAKGYTQEELAIRLHVVRQTISKWEKGLSVPDAELLAKIAEIFEVSAGDLLDEKIEAVIESNTMIEQLSRVNEQLAISNRRSLRVWRTIAVACMTFIFISAIGVVISNVVHNTRLIKNDAAFSNRDGLTVDDDAIVIYSQNRDAIAAEVYWEIVEKFDADIDGRVARGIATEGGEYIVITVTEP